MTSTCLDRSMADERGPYLITRGGVHLRLRPVAVNDAALLAAFFSHLSADDLRFRFLDSCKQPSIRDISSLVEVDHRRTEHILAFDTSTGELVATLLISADAKMDVADVTIAVATDWKGRGIGWTLLRYASDLAFVRGVRKLRSVESPANHEALDVEHALGFHARTIDGDSSLVLVETVFA